MSIVDVRQDQQDRQDFLLLIYLVDPVNPVKKHVHFLFWDRLLVLNHDVGAKPSSILCDLCALARVHSLYY